MITDLVPRLAPIYFYFRQIDLCSSCLLVRALLLRVTFIEGFFMIFPEVIFVPHVDIDNVLKFSLNWLLFEDEVSWVDPRRTFLLVLLSFTTLIPFCNLELYVNTTITCEVILEVHHYLFFFLTGHQLPTTLLFFLHFCWCCLLLYLFLTFFPQHLGIQMATLILALLLLFCMFSQLFLLFFSWFFEHGSILPDSFLHH